MTPYRHRRLRPYQISAKLLRALVHLMGHWRLFLLAALILSPIGPHLRFQYSYYARGTSKYMVDCDYLGPRGFVKYVDRGDCPLIAIIDRRKAIEH